MTRPPRKARRAAVVLVGLLLSCLGVALMDVNADADNASMSVTRANGAVVATDGPVVAGEKLTIHLAGFAPSTTVVIDVGPAQLAPSPKTDAKGAALVPFSVPRLAPAPYVISATAGGMTTTTVVTVVTAPAATPSPTPTAPHTASPSASASSSRSASVSPASTGAPAGATSSAATTPAPSLTSSGTSASATALAKTGPSTPSLSLGGATLLAVGVVLVVVGGAGGSRAARHVRVAGAHVRRH